MIQFDFNTAPRIFFKSGGINDIANITREFGTKALLVSGAHISNLKSIINILESNGIHAHEYIRDGEPSVSTINSGIKIAVKANVEFVIAIGGGSAIDTGKAISAMLTNPGNLEDYLEVIGKNLPLQKQAAPFIAIPTTAGTGSEVTRNAVIRVKEHGIKVSLRGAKIIPRVALIDPEMTFDLPDEIIASTGMDALTQLIEPFISNKANEFSDMLCMEGIKRNVRSLTQAFQNKRDIKAREDLCYASLLGGMALANSGLGAVHGIAGVLGGMYTAPHGALCARLLPLVFNLNAEKILHEDNPSRLKEKICLLVKLLTNTANEEIDTGVQFLEKLAQDQNIPRLATYGIAKKDFPRIIEKSLNSSSMKGNPVTLTEGEISQILEQAL